MDQSQFLEQLRHLQELNRQLYGYVYSAFRKRIYRQFYRSWPDPQLCEDLTQIVFHDAMYALVRIDNLTSAGVYAYFAAVAANVAKRHLKERNNCASLDPQFLPPDPKARDPRPDVELREYLSLCWRSNSLNLREKTALLMRMADFSYDDIGDELGISANAAKTVVCRARAKMAICLAQFGIQIAK